MPYRTPLESRIASKVTRAIVDHRLIEDGDRIMVGLSGGKDSWALMQILDVLRQRAPITFSLVAVTVDSGYEDFRHDLIRDACAERGWEHHVERTSIGAVMDDLLDPRDTPCSLCARLRRGVLYRLADRVGATKIALGHHSDDFIETLLLNLFFAGALKAMPARLVSDNGRHVVIRPLVYVSEDEARAYAKESGLPIVGCCCPACGDLSLQRQRVKRLIFDLEREHPGVKASMLRALATSTPRHLLDRAPEPAGRAAGDARRLTPGVSRVDAAVRAVIQRVSRARVRVGAETVGEIGPGLLALVGVAADDGPADIAYIAGKIRDLRVFEDDARQDEPRPGRDRAEPCWSSRSSRCTAMPEGQAAVVRSRGAGRRRAHDLRRRRGGAARSGRDRRDRHLPAPTCRWNWSTTAR